jgi:hypothetical protein
MKKRPIAAAALIAALLLVWAIPGSTQTEPTVEERLDRLECAVFEENCEPDPSPSPTVSPTPTMSPSPSPSPTNPVSCTGVRVTAPASIQTAINNNPTNTPFCLSGTFHQGKLRPKDGQSFKDAGVVNSPATLDGDDTFDTGFQIRTNSGSTTGAEGVTIDNVDMHSFTLRGVDCWIGTTVRNSEIYNNNRNALGCGLLAQGDVLIEDNHVHDNGSPEESGSGGGGMKFARGDGVLVRRNLVERNIGNGIWCDVDCGLFEVRNNEVRGNTRKGIFFEISKGPFFAVNNDVTENNCSPVWWPNPKPACDLPNGTFGPQNSGAPGGGIATNSSCPASSQQCVIRDNVLGGNMASGITHRDDSRQYNAPFNILVTGNDLNGDQLQKCGQWGIVCTGNELN